MALASTESFSDYDPLAWFYDMYWGPASRDQLEPVVEEVLLDRLPGEARVLDLCCGTGHLCQTLSEHGLDVQGIDGSRAMLAYARNNAPGVTFHRADARAFEVEEPVDAVLCTYESLNHVLTEEELLGTFERVYAALEDDGWFLFDMNMADAYGTGWAGTDGIIEDDHVLFVSNTVSPEERLATSEITLFRHAHGAWRRSDLILQQRWYDEETLLSTLADAGFETAAIFDAEDDLDLQAEVGRTFFLVRKGPLDEMTDQDAS